MKPSDKISPDEQKEYILLDNAITNYKKLYGWKPGTKLKRISKWLGSNGLGRDIKQAYFIPVNSNDNHGQIAWSDDVKEVTGQLELEI